MAMLGYFTLQRSSNDRCHNLLLQNDEPLHIASISLDVNRNLAGLGLGIFFQFFEKIRELSELEMSQDATYRLSVRDPTLQHHKERVPVAQ